VITVYRLSTAQFADTFWTGQGGLHVDGRWHTSGRRIVYTAQSLSLAQLEVLVHISDRRQMPELNLAQASIPDELLIRAVDPSILPPNWRRFSPYSEATQRLGNEWLAQGKAAVLKVPSAISTAEWNFLFNPAHRDLTNILLGKPQPFAMDPRLH
jgi:RES domain-containing protein